MNKCKKIISYLLSFALLFSTITPTFAEINNVSANGGAGQSKVTAIIEASNFDITVPIGLPINVNKDGTVTVATDAKIVNNSNGPVVINNVTLTSQNNWQLASYTDNYKAKKAGSKELGFKLNNENANVDGTFNMVSVDWPSIAGHGELALNYDGKVPAQNADVATTTAATVEFLFQWDDGAARLEESDVLLGRTSTYQLHVLDTTGLISTPITAFASILATAISSGSGTTYSSSDTSIATVDSNGVITGVNPGKATITATLGLDTDICNVTVLDLSVSSTEGGIASLSYANKEQSSTVKFAATSNKDFIFTGWTNEKNEIVSTKPLYTADLLTNLNLKANFKRTNENLTVTLAAGDGGSVSGDGSYFYGEIVSIKATPNKGYKFISWSDGNTNSFRQFIINQNMDLTATFAATATMYSITANTDANGGGTVTGGGIYAKDSTVTLTATPNENYEFVNWTDMNNNVESNSTFTFTATKAITWTAHFKNNAVTNKYNVTLTAGVGGSVAGAGSYDSNTEATITATPDTGYHFVKWSDDNTSSTRKITVTKDLSLTATFEKDGYALTVKNDEGGTANIVADGNPTTGSYNYGDSVTLNATANDHATFVNWTSDSGETITQNSFVTTVHKAVTWTAHFKLDSYTLTITANDGGSASGSGTYTYGKEAAISATPKPGYHFTSI
jgi:uncharacterized repeat protein (TIGR02543 family)